MLQLVLSHPQAVNDCKLRICTTVYVILLENEISVFNTCCI